MPRAVKEWIGKTPDTKAPPRVLRRIFERENGICYLSGRKITPADKWQGDHKIAIINGGENRESNLFPALADKHKEKTKRDLAEKAQVAALANSHLNIRSAPGKKMQGRDFQQSEQAVARASRPQKQIATGLSNLARRYPQ
jgi:5-methylcytosine-specific restriction enzyme A